MGERGGSSRQAPASLCCRPGGFFPSALVPVGCLRGLWQGSCPPFSSSRIAATLSCCPLFHLIPPSLGMWQSCPGFHPTHRLFFKLQIIFKFKITFCSETFKKKKKIFFFKLKSPGKHKKPPTLPLLPSPAPSWV